MHKVFLLLNYILRGFLHSSVTGMLYIALRNHINIVVFIALSLLLAMVLEYKEAKALQDNSQNQFTLIRDTALAVIALIFWIELNFFINEPLFTVAYAMSLTLLSYLVDKKYKKDFKLRINIKIYLDIISYGLGPLITYFFIQSL